MKNKYHRGVLYTPIEWRTYNNHLCKGYVCKDEKLLDGLNTISFQSFSDDEMKRKIDHYIDNKQELLNKQKLTDEAIKYSYEKLGWPLD
jgi:hypothetical protein